MIKRVFRWLFSEPASKQNEIELRNAIIAELYAHLEHIGHPVEAVRVPLFAIPETGASSVHDAASVVVAVEHVFETEYGGFRLIAGLDTYGRNVVTGRSASATATSSTLSLVGHAARPSSALPPTWAEASRVYNEGLDRAAHPYPRPATVAEAAEYFARKKGPK